MTDSTQILIGLLIAVIALIFMLTKTKIHVFLAMIIAALLTGILGGMDPIATVEVIKGGFGSTLGNLGILISFGVMMGKILEKSGAAERIARTFMNIFGEGNEEVAFTTTGFITSLAIFCVPGFVILYPLVKIISRQTKKSVVGLGMALAGGLLISHSIMIPASGPIGTAGIFGADLASMMFWGFIISIPMYIIVVLYAKYIGNKIPRIPDESGEGWVEGEEAIANEVVQDEQSNIDDLPGVGVSFAPILAPIILILASNLLGSGDNPNFFIRLIDFLGQPVVALGISVLIAIIFLARDMSRDETLAAMDEGIASGAKILLIVGAGGALGAVVNESGAGDVIANWIAETPLPPILLPLIISTILRFIQGSGSVASTTAASITAPIMAQLGVSPVFSALAAAVGSMFFSYFNDSYFWTINESIGNDEVKDQIQTWSIPTTIMWAVGSISVLILNGLFG